MSRPTFRSVTLHVTGSSMRRTFLVLCLGTALIFVFTGVIAVIQAEKKLTGAPEVQKWTSRVTVGTWLKVMEEGVPFLSSSVEGATPLSWSGLFFQLLTSVNPEDPRSYLGRELPGFALFDGEFVIKGEGVDYTDAPIESAPPPPDVEPPELKEGALGEDKPEGDEGEAADGEERSTDGKKRVFIYHTHWYESFLPYLKTENPNLAFHPEKNITKVGKQFAAELEKLGIGAQVSDKSYAYVDRKDYYSESGKTVQAAMQQNKDLHYFFDIHRDSQRRGKTAVTINGRDFARVMFVIGKGNDDYEQNYKLAKRFHDQLQKMYPGLSRGVYSPGGKGVNGVYNQDLSPNALLIEVGGVDNTFEELNRTASALARAFAEMYWEAEPVDAKVGQ